MSDVCLKWPQAENLLRLGGGCLGRSLNPGHCCCLAPDNPELGAVLCNAGCLTTTPAFTYRLQSPFGITQTVSWRRKWNPLGYSCLENPTDGGACLLSKSQSVGSLRVRHDSATKWMKKLPLDMAKLPLGGKTTHSWRASDIWEDEYAIFSDLVHSENISEKKVWKLTEGEKSV